MEQKKYWQGIEGLLDESKLNAKKKNEFQEDLPILNEVGNIASQTNGSRRDFLKVMGFSLGAATLAASCEIPVKKAIPYVVKPEQVLPGMPTFYASTFVNGSDYCSILVKTREGRPIKIEGNSASSVTQGGTSARVQASVVSLYDGARLRQPVKGGVKASWEAVDKDIAAGLASARGQKVILTGSVVSPSTRQLIQDFSAKYGNVSHVIYEPISQSGITTANQRTFGKKMIPAYHFDKAKVIVGIGCDFLGTWISPVEFTKQYTKNRRIDVSNRTMSKHWQFEGMMSTTGGKADERCTVKPSQEGLVAVALYNELVGGGSSVALDDTVKAKIKKCAADLKANAGRALVVSGSNDADVQEVVNAINQKVGSYGNTIDTSVSYNTHQGDDQAMQKLVSDMNTGNVGALLIYGVNPVYSYPQSDKLISGLQKVGLSVSLNDRIDETGQNVKYICPDNHYLESWGDAEIKTGHYSLIQPTISPLFDTRQAQDSLLTWMGADVSYYDYIQAYWKLNVASKQNKYADFQTFWDNALHDGVVEVGGKSTSVVVPAVAEAAETEGAETEAEEAVVAAPVSGGGDASNAALKVVGKAVKGEELELKLYESVTIGDGRYANNPFLQETPDPITKVCWENILAVSPKYAAEKGWEDYDRIKVKAGGFEVEVPMITQPGQKYGTFALALGYGRTHAGSDFSETGANAYPFVKTGGETFGYAVTSGLSVEKIRASKTYEVASTQMHHIVDDTNLPGRAPRPIVREASLDEYKKDDYAGNHDKKHFEEHFDDHFMTLFGDDKTYGPHKSLFKQGHHWGLSVDLNTCTGCNACVTACNIENNVPVVGKHEVGRSHEMHWMRIDRYYSIGVDPRLDKEAYLEKAENPEVTFMPMMCQHCDNAPCENVCPVAATNHSSEGLNQMAYNRCIGTRYCANNCPFKVRRFNWFDYQGADSFYKNTVFSNDERLGAELVLMDDLTRMVLNPDVTVRSRGVMEKCSFCVQRIQTGKLEAKKEGRKLKDGEIQTACQTACPANALVFGDMNDPESAVMKEMKKHRSYKLLEEIHVLPSVNYMTQIRNRPARAGAHHDDHHAEGSHS